MKILRNTPIVVFLIYILFVHGYSIQVWLHRGLAEIEKAVKHGITIRIEPLMEPTTPNLKSDSRNENQY